MYYYLQTRRLADALGRDHEGLLCVPAMGLPTHLDVNALTSIIVDDGLVERLTGEELRECNERALEEFGRLVTILELLLRNEAEGDPVPTLPIVGNVLARDRSQAMGQEELRSDADVSDVPHEVLADRGDIRVSVTAFDGERPDPVRAPGDGEADGDAGIANGDGAVGGLFSPRANFATNGHRASL